MLVLIVKFQLKPEHRDRFIATSLGDAQGSVRDEPGCLRFDVIQDESDPNRIYFYEVYAGEAAFQEHLKAPHFLAWRDSISDEWYAEPSELVRGQSLFPTDEAWKK